jgi:predicted dehydrogenase
VPTTIRRKTFWSRLKRRVARRIGCRSARRQSGRTIKLGLIGLGSAANWKLDEIVACPDLTLEAVCDTQPEAIAAVLRKHRVPHVFDDHRSLLALRELDGVIISTPNALHCPISLDALAAGKHVLCEKPLALNADEARRMVEAAGESCRQALVHFPYRLSAEAQFARRLIAEGRLGRPYHLSIVYAHGGWYAEDGRLRDAPGVGGWRADRRLAGSGVLSDLGSHALDLARSWLGDADSISASLIHHGNDGPDGIDDTASWRVRYQSGVIGTFVSSRCHTGRHQHFEAELYGSRGAFRLSPGTFHWFETKTGRWMEVAVPQGFGRSIITQFVRAILGRTPETATFDDGLRVQELLDAAIRSNDQQREVRLEPGQQVSDWANERAGNVVMSVP